MIAASGTTTTRQRSPVSSPRSTWIIIADADGNDTGRFFTSSSASYTAQLQGCRECLWHLTRLPFGSTLQWLHCPRLAEVQYRIKLLRQAGREVVAEALRLRPVNDADRPLQPRRTQKRGSLATVP